ncbi:MAG: MarR family transcriptional regulator [Desulforhopalus sp.]
MTGHEQSLLALEHQLTTLVRVLEALNRYRSYPLERAQYLLLLQLIEGPLSIGELATRLLLDNSTVTRQINVMLKINLIEKIPNPNDARSTLVASTPTGREQAEAMHQLRLSRLRVTLENWSGDDKKALAGLTHRLILDLIHNMAIS